MLKGMQHHYTKGFLYSVIKFEWSSYTQLSAHYSATTGSLFRTCGSIHSQYSKDTFSLFKLTILSNTLSLLIVPSIVTPRFFNMVSFYQIAIVQYIGILCKKENICCLIYCTKYLWKFHMRNFILKKELEEEYQC